MSLAATTRKRVAPLGLVELELDLEVFAGPFDLLLTLILREEVDLLEVDLADIVISYIDHLESKGELDLEAATEFLVLITALLELKSRLMLPGEEIEELELEPGEAATELLQRLLDAHRYRTAAEHLAGLLRHQAGYRFRSAPLPASLRKAALPEATAVYDPARLAKAIGELLVLPPEVDVRHIPVPKVTVAERLTLLRGLLRRGSFNFDEAVEGADRVTVVVTLFSLLELYKQGELTWSQDQPFGEIQVKTAQPVIAEAGRMTLSLGATIEALLFLSPEPLSAAVIAGAAEVEIDEVNEALGELVRQYEEAGRGLVLRDLAAGGWVLSSHPEAEDAARNLFARPRTPALTPAQAETLAIIAYLQPVSRPEIARIRGVNAESAAATLLERGLVEESGRSQFGAVLYRTTELFMRLFGLERLDELPPISAFDPSPELEEELRERLLRAGEARTAG